MGHVSHRKRRSQVRTAARIVLVLGILTVVGAAVNFSYLAYKSGDCYTTSTDPYSGEPQRGVPVDSDECRLTITRRDASQRGDAAIALLAIVVAIGAAVRLSNASRRTQRVVLMLEVAVVTVGVVYTILLASVLR